MTAVSRSRAGRDTKNAATICLCSAWPLDSCLVPCFPGKFGPGERPELLLVMVRLYPRSARDHYRCTRATPDDAHSTLSMRSNSQQQELKRQG